MFQYARVHHGANAIVEVVSGDRRIDNEKDADCMGRDGFLPS